MTQMNSSTKRTHRHREQTYGCQRGGKDWEFGISRCKLVYIEWINSKVRLYSTENYIQYLVINHNEKDIKQNVYIYITQSLRYMVEINTTL